MAAEIESSDEEIVSSRRRRLSSGRKRQLFTDSGNDSSDAENECCTKRDKQVSVCLLNINIFRAMGQIL